MAIRVEAGVYISATEPGSEKNLDVQIDPLPLLCDGVGDEITVHTGSYGANVRLSDLRSALDAAERIQKEDGR